MHQKNTFSLTSKHVCEILLQYQYRIQKLVNFPVFPVAEATLSPSSSPGAPSSAESVSGWVRFEQDSVDDFSGIT